MEQLIIDQLHEHLSVIASPAKLEELGNMFEETSLCFQTLAICNILTGYHKEGYIANMQSSAYTLRYYLIESKNESNDSHFTAISRSEGFLDAIAIGDIALAKEIVDLSNPEWIEDGEYEDDFAYYYFLHGLIQSFPDINTEMLEKRFERLENSVTTSTETRLEICRSFLEKDSVAFNEAFSELLFEFDEQKDERFPFLLDIAELYPRKYIFTEGLALLHIAELLGFETDVDYQYCPSITRVKKAPQPSADLYEDIRRIRQSGKF